MFDINNDYYNDAYCNVYVCRPWYVAAAVPEPRDIVIVIDQSGSMSNRVGSKSRMNLAKEAAKIVLDTLNPHDNVG